MSEAKKVIVVIGAGVVIHVSIAAIMYAAHKHLTQERNRKTDATKKAWDDCKEVLVKILEKQKTNDAFWEQMKAEFPEDMLGT